MIYCCTDCDAINLTVKWMPRGFGARCFREMSVKANQLLLYPNCSNNNCSPVCQNKGGILIRIEQHLLYLQETGIASLSFPFVLFMLIYLLGVWENIANTFILTYLEIDKNPYCYQI